MRNHTTRSALENIQAVFVRLGSTAAMAAWARKNETEFYRIYARLLPIQVEAKTISISLSYKRDAQAFEGRTIENEPKPAKGREERVERLLSAHKDDVRRTLELVLADVPDQDVQEVYERAIGTVLEAAQRGDNEKPAIPMLTQQVVPAAEGYGMNLDQETEEEKETLKDVMRRIEEHNQKVLKK